MSGEISIDAFVPQEMAEKAETIGVRKAGMAFLPMFALAVLAGAFIGLGAMFATTVYAGGSVLPYGVARLLMGLAFCLGLILVVVAGAELFTGNNLIVMAWADGKVTTGALLRNWVIVYLGNFVGSLGTAGLAKCNLGFPQALALGILCNALVCLAVWLTYSARSVSDKILAILFPITAFVAAGFEHSVANMYFIPFGLLIKTFDPAFVTAHKLDLANLTWNAFFLNNLLPVTLGNILGGAGLVALMYWFIYLRPLKATQKTSQARVNS